MRSLRAQRAAVEKLKETARAGESTAEVLRRKLGEAENRIQELRAQGGRDVVRRLMDEVCGVTDCLFFFKILESYLKDHYHSCMCATKVCVSDIQQ